MKTKKLKIDYTEWAITITVATFYLTLLYTAFKYMPW